MCIIIYCASTTCQLITFMNLQKRKIFNVPNGGGFEWTVKYGAVRLVQYFISPQQLFSH